MHAYPIELDLRSKTAVVVGLGPVGRRKAEKLLEAGARVIGIEPNPVDFPTANFTLVGELYRPEHLKNASLVIAAATFDVNQRVVVDAKDRGIWVNSASDPASGDFTLPASWSDGPITLTVSTAGASPVLATTLRDRAAKAIGTSAGGFASLLLELRPEILATITDPEARRRAFIDAAHPRWLDRFALEGPEDTRIALRVALGLDHD